MPVAGSYNLVLILSGVAVGLFGWVLYWAGVPVLGGIVGACAGGALGMFAADFVQEPWALPLFLGIGIALGAILGVLLTRAIQVYFFFAAGASLGGALAWRFLHGGPLREFAANTSATGLIVIVLLAALAGGLVLVWFRRFIVAVATSIVGVLLVTAGLPPQYQMPGALIALVVFLAAQIGLVRRFVEKESFDRRMRRYREERPNVDTAE